MKFLNYPLFVFTCLLNFVSCKQVEYSRSVGNQYDRGANQSGQSIEESETVQLEKPEYKVVYRKSNLETLSLGRNRIEIQELMGEPDGKSLDGGNGYLWDYRRPVFDETTDEVYGWSLISFKFLKGLCAYVNIRLEQPPPELLQEQATKPIFKF
ncbi:MAG: hypothetical protein P8O23_03295 [Opitutales bacterium]|nr:hypothetical protein [Opitutales bacterium]